MNNKKNILIVDDDITTSSKYKKWLEEDGGFNLTLINDPEVAEQNFNPEKYDLVLISFKMSIIDGFEFYQKLYELSKEVQQDTSPSNDFRVCFITTSRINYEALVEIHPELEKNVMFVKKFQKQILSNMSIR